MHPSAASEPPAPSSANIDPGLLVPEGANHIDSQENRAERPPSLTYLLKQSRQPVEPARSSKRGGSHIVIPASFDIDSDTPLSAVTEESGENWRAPWDKSKPARPLSTISGSTAKSVDLDAIPEYRFEDGESDIFTDVMSVRMDGPNRKSEMSSADLSKRADLILANAKKRLNLMDQNLKGARALTAENLQRAASLNAHESPYANRYLKNRENASPYTPEKKGHLRQRSDMPQMQSPARARRIHVGGNPEESDEPVIQVATVLRVSRSQELPRSPRLYTATRGGAKASPDPNGSPRAPPRATSPVTEDLKNKVESLNQRISQLRERTKADHMRRKSDQNLRQASPFTDAAQELPSTTREPAGQDSVTVESARWQAVPHFSVDPAVSGHGDLVSQAGEIMSQSRSETTETDEEDKAHEDRSDAFDYRTSYLHSNVGRTSRLSNTDSEGTAQAHSRVASLDFPQPPTHKASLSDSADSAVGVPRVSHPLTSLLFDSTLPQPAAEDRALLASLLQGLKVAAVKMQGPDGDKQQLRSRVEAARRMLDLSLPLPQS